VRLAGLMLFMAGMWLMVLAVAAFLVLFVAPIDVLLHGQGRLAISMVQAAIAIIAVIALVLGLSRMKRIYLQKKLRL
jgi:hypothetical protein